jgi:hypothetical protein
MAHRERLSLRRLFTIAVGLCALLATATDASPYPEQPPPPPLELESALASALSTPSPEEQPSVVRVYFADRQQLLQLVSWFEPWEINRQQGFAIVAAWPAEIEQLRQAGFSVEIDQELTRRLNTPLAPLPGQLSGIPSYPCYRTVEETYASAAALAASYPNLASWNDIGDSWEKTSPGGQAGYDLMALRLTNAAISGPKPKLFVMSSVHAREYAPAELMTRFAEMLLAGYGSNPEITWVLDHHEIHLLLHANPDGRKRAETGLAWRKNTNANYCKTIPTSYGADLNRNFSFQWGCCGGSSGSQCSETYRGPLPASEPETRAIQNYVREQFADRRDLPLSAAAPLDTSGIFLDIHSYGELLLWPWGFTEEQAPNHTQLQTLGRKLAYANRYYPEQAIGLYPTDGTTDDFAYGDLGLAGFTYELGTDFFQDCTTFEEEIVPDNLVSLFYAAKTVRAPYLLPAGPEALSLKVSPALAFTDQSIQISASLVDGRYNSANGIEPTQNIAAAEFYIDTPPWADLAATPYAMNPQDGAFNAKTEKVTAVIAPGLLNPGRHILYVRGQDLDGNWGAFSAVYLDVQLRSLFAPFLIGP